MGSFLALYILFYIIPQYFVLNGSKLTKFSVILVLCVLLHTYPITVIAAPSEMITSD